MVTPKIRRRIKRKLCSEKPTIWVGKSGATKQVIEQVSKQLERKEMVKIRILRSALRNDEAENVASKIAQQTEANLIDVRGHTFMLYKRRRKGEKSL